MEKKPAHSASQKIAYTVREVVDATGISRSDIYKAFRAGELSARKRGARTLILDSDLRKFLRSLPRLTANHRRVEGKP